MNSNFNTENGKISLKDEFCVFSNAGNMSVENDISEEYVLPDYFPDIRKILLVKAKTEESDMFNENGRVEVGGEAVFEVIYLGDEGKVRSIVRNIPYSANVSSDDLYDDSVLNVKTALKNRSVRAISPRKLSLKGKVVTDISVYNKLCVSPRLSGNASVEDEFKLERLVENVDCVNYIQFEENDIRVSEDLKYEGKEPIFDLVSCSCDIFTTECKYYQGKLNIKGLAKVSCLISSCSDDSEDEKYQIFEKNISINHTADVSLPGEDWNVYTSLDLGAFESSISNDNYGESRIIEIDFSCRAKVTAVRNEESVVTGDMFSTEYSSSVSYKKIETERVSKCCCTNFSASGSSELPQNAGAEYERIFVSSADADMNLSEVKNGKAVFSGECSVKAVAQDTNASFTNHEFSFPIRFEMPCEDIAECRAICKSGIIDSRITLDGNKVNANVEVGLDAVLFEKISKNSVEEVVLDKSLPVERAEKTMILYYPEKKESLWSIAKKYNITRSSIEKANNKKMTEPLPRVILIPVSV